jgi:hypothetical protein
MPREAEPGMPDGYQRKKEDVSTDVMAYLLTKPSAQWAFRKPLGDKLGTIFCMAGKERW